MLWLLRRRLGGLGSYGVRTLIVKALASAIAMGVVAELVAWLLTPALRIGHTAGHIIIVGGAGLAAVLVYGAMMVALRVQELDILRQLIAGRRA